MKADHRSTIIGHVILLFTIILIQIGCLAKLHQDIVGMAAPAGARLSIDQCIRAYGKCVNRFHTTSMRVFWVLLCPAVAELMLLSSVYSKSVRAEQASRANWSSRYTLLLGCTTLCAIGLWLQTVHGGYSRCSVVEQECTSGGLSERATANTYSTRARM